MRRAGSTIPHPERVEITSTPVRGEFFELTKAEARQKLGFTDDKPLVLTSWGSLGAQVMNDYMVDFVVRECKDGTPSTTSTGWAPGIMSGC